LGPTCAPRAADPMMDCRLAVAVARVWAAAVEWMAPAELLSTAEAMRAGTFWLESPPTLETRVGDVLVKLAELRKRVGVLKAKKKDGVRFKVRSADELADRVRPEIDDLGLLIYPVHVAGKGQVIEGNEPGKVGTLAEVTVTLRVQAISDKSYVDIMGFGLGADNQDKAGGKAGTYAWKTALIQALTAGGEKDTDDTDTPIQGGVRPKAAPPYRKVLDTVTREAVEAIIVEARAGKSMARLKDALAAAKGLSEADQLELSTVVRAAASEIRGAA
jgi:ERF superfamily protein